MPRTAKLGDLDSTLIAHALRLRIQQIDQSEISGRAAQIVLNALADALETAGRVTAQDQQRLDQIMNDISRRSAIPQEIIEQYASGNNKEA